MTILSRRYARFFGSSILYGLATIGAFWLLSRAFVLIHQRNLFFDEKTVLVSPKNDYRLVLLKSHGGGGIAPFCDYVLAILSADQPDDMANQQNLQVAEFGCLALRQGGLGHGITWTDDTSVSVTIDLDAALNSGYVLLRPHDLTGQVRVHYRSSP